MSLRSGPAPTFGLGFTGFTESLLKYYHKAGDHFENFDPVYMQRYWTATQAIADHLVRMTNLPFWKPEEPFYETGKALYGL